MEKGNAPAHDEEDWKSIIDYISTVLDMEGHELSLYSQQLLVESIDIARRHTG